MLVSLILKKKFFKGFPYLQYIYQISILFIVKVWGFNVANVDYELSFIFTETDMQQFR